MTQDRPKEYLNQLESSIFADMLGTGHKVQGGGLAKSV